MQREAGLPAAAYASNSHQARISEEQHELGGLACPPDEPAGIEGQIRGGGARFQGGRGFSRQRRGCIWVSSRESATLDVGAHLLAHASGVRPDLLQSSDQGLILAL